MKTFKRGLLAISCLVFASTSALAAAPTGRANPRLMGTRAIVACDAVRGVERFAVVTEVRCVDLEDLGTEAVFGPRARGAVL